MCGAEFSTEREGQITFFERFGIKYTEDDVLKHHNDGVVKGVLFEFKLNVNNAGATLFQAIKYLSQMRVRGESVPKYILLVSLNKHLIYVYESKDYFDEIHEVYFGAASKNNSSFSPRTQALILDYHEMCDAQRVKEILKAEEYLPIKIDENCIVGWAERYYREKPTATKGDFIGYNKGFITIIGEIREPKHFKNLIEPYTGETNEKFKYLMDKLNDKLKKKELGAFYTPEAYCVEAAKLLREAIKKVPKDNDYVIIDRCAGTGNLEAVLTDEELSHCIVSTYEYYEYKVLCERLGDRVRVIVPPTEDVMEYDCGFILNTDATSKKFLDNKIIKPYLEREDCTVILFENPPFSEASTLEMHKNNNKDKFAWKSSYVMNEMKREHKGSMLNDLANLFIWSGFKYYLRQPTDSYILFSPAKYWKSQHLIDKKFNGGFIANRKHFHAKSASAITCVSWQNVDDDNDVLTLPVYDIENSKSKLKLKDLNKTMTLKKVHELFSAFYDKRVFDNDASGITCSPNAFNIKSISQSPFKNAKYNSNIVGYLVAKSFGTEHPDLNTSLTTVAHCEGHGFYLREDNFIEKLPLFAAGKFLKEEKIWYNDLIFRTYDCGNKFVKDKHFMNYCLIYTCLCEYNRCLSFIGSDGREYQNKLCFDADTLASQKLAEIKLTKQESELINLYYKILTQAKQTQNYNATFKYGVYQITKELNTSHKDKHDKTQYDYPELNGDLKTLKTKLKDYYLEIIKPDLFKYELLK
jgi:hypothetical protein